MKRKVLGIIILLLILTYGLLAFFDDRFPPRTAHRVGRMLSDLPIPSSARVRLFDDRYGNGAGEGGDGHTQIVFDLSQEDCNMLRGECFRAGFIPYTMSVSERLPSTNYPVTVDMSLYKLMRQDKYMPAASYAVVMLDLAKRQLIVFNIVS